jgi:hypothetical protein
MQPTLQWRLRLSLEASMLGGSLESGGHVRLLRFVEICSESW